MNRYKSSTYQSLTLLKYLFPFIETKHYFYRHISKGGLRVDQTNIEELFSNYYRDVYQFSLYFSNNVQDAEDITQETFLKAIKNIHSLKDTSKAKYWLLSIARNTSIDHLRKKKIKAFLPDLFEKTLLDEGAKSLDDYIIVKEKWEEVQLALLKLKPQYRSVMILRGIQELTTREAAEVLNCTELKVRVDFHRAVKLLKKELELQNKVVNLDERNRKIDSRG